MNKSENSKLSLEPQQMKRKKKGTEYNLRKSLAWDRAFFTEEGVLDPLELSIITGASPKGLPFTHKASPGLLLSCNLSEEPKDESLYKDRKKDFASNFPNSSSSRYKTSTAPGSLKPPTHLGTKLSSVGSNYSRPVSSSSTLKRPANVPTGKSADKESKLPKLPDPARPSLNPIAASKNCTALKANHVKHNQFTQPGSSKPGVSSLHSSCGSKGHNSSLPRPPPANKNIRRNEKVQPSASKMISEDMRPERPINACVAKDDPKICAVPLLDGAHASSPVMHTLPIQSIKPSGLRMPSPSLSVFSQQSKSSVSCRISPGETETAVYGPKDPPILRLKELRTPNVKGTIDRISETIHSGLEPTKVVRPNVESDIPNTEENCSKARKISGHEVSGVLNQYSELRSENHFAEFSVPKSIGMSEMNELSSVEEGKNTLVLNQGVIEIQCDHHDLDASVQSSLRISSDFIDFCDSNGPEPRMEETDPRHERDSDKKESKSLQSLEELDCTAGNSDLCLEQAHFTEVLYNSKSAGEALDETISVGQESTSLVSEMRHENECCENEAVVKNNYCVEVQSDPQSRSCSDQSTITDVAIELPKVEPLKTEVASASNNKQEGVSSEKRRPFVPPENATPFSDEWLAAIEAAGEDILTKKGGAVQHSPPDKSQPEPGPWSPVKKKSNQIGPYDCTKFTNILLGDSK